MIIYTEEQWANSPLSIARHYGEIIIEDKEYIIVNKEGKDVFECTAEAEKEGREMAIPAGEPCDLIDKKFIPIYRKLGRMKFLEMVKAGMSFEQMKEHQNN